ncbi:hypothetical protein ACTHPB_27760 [Priestia megaterium]|uniref:hypothetical protein n=1 Tax=Priestia TaxID=2800373 RepID=UPI002040D9DA|nr:hypothetical protein [Priestia aryabhattai]MCM3773992.1 hypothetical protein [Priestia aryabhattai]
MDFKKWLQTLVEEKGLSYECFTVKHEEFIHFIEMDYLIDFLSGLDKEMQDTIKTTLVKIDFMNGDVMHFLDHCATGYIQVVYQ